MNLNPFMKFDGYHIASDIMGIENLQDRAMVLGRWRLRELLFATRVPLPDPLPARVITLLTLYAWSLWLYRLIVFTGIALVVYHFFFKLAGIVLFAIEIGYFIVAPILREIREWWKMRRSIIDSGRSLLTAATFAVIVALLAIPLSSQVRIPAVLESAEISRLYPKLPARIDELKVNYGDQVEAGATLVSLKSFELVQELELNRLHSQVVALRLDRGASDVNDREEAAVLQKKRAALEQERVGLERQRAQLDITAPFAGKIVEMLPGLHAGRTLSPKDVVLVVRGSNGGEVHGALDEGDVWRLKPGAEAHFVPDDLNLPIVIVRVDAISQSAMASLDQVEFASSHGGRVADRLDANRQPVPVTAQYAVRGKVAVAMPDAYLARSATGLLVAQGVAESISSRLWRQVLKVLVRESGI